MLSIISGTPRGNATLSLPLFGCSDCVLSAANTKTAIGLYWGSGDQNPQYPVQPCPHDIACRGLGGATPRQHEQICFPLSHTPLGVHYSSPSPLRRTPKRRWGLYRDMTINPAHMISSAGGRGVQPPRQHEQICFPLSHTPLGVHYSSPSPLRRTPKRR